MQHDIDKMKKDIKETFKNIISENYLDAIGELAELTEWQREAEKIVKERQAKMYQELNKLPTNILGQIAYEKIDMNEILGEAISDILR